MPTTTTFIWDDENCLAETDGSNTINVVYTNEPQQYGNLVSARIGTTTSYHHFDAIGSTRQLTNGANVKTDTMLFDAWGNVATRTGSSTLVLLWIGEVGYYYDRETGLFSVRDRPYGPSVARWMSLDVLGFVDGLNRYAYVMARPTLLVDPSGLLACKGKPTGPVYVSRQGTFDADGTLDKPTGVGFWFLTTSISIFWQPLTPGEFNDGKCCCCDNVGFIQIAKEEGYSNLWPWNVTHNSDWQVDTGYGAQLFLRSPLYPHTNSTSTPCSASVMKNRAGMGDQPNVSAPFFNRVYSSVQSFETCAVCIKGNEGMVTTTEGVWEPPDNVVTVTRIGGVTIYGCIKWSQSYFRTSSKPATRSLAIGTSLKTSPPSALPAVVNVADYTAQPPSGTFLDTLTKWNGQSYG